MALNHLLKEQPALHSSGKTAIPVLQLCQALGWHWGEVPGMGEVSQKGVETHAAICAVALEAENSRQGSNSDAEDNEAQPQ